MRKSLIKFMLPALLVLAGTAISCQQEKMDNNPNFNPETKEVTTQFVLSVSTDGEARPETKTTADMVQKATNFRGITDAVIFTYVTGSTGTAFVNSSSTTANKRFNMGDLYTNGSITPADNATSSSNRVLQLSIPVGTDAVLFYGKATEATGSSTITKEQIGGSTELVIKDKAAETEFKAVRRMPETEVDAYDATARLMIFVINRIMSSEIAAATGEAYGYAAADLPAVSWRDYGLQYEINNGMRAGTTKAQIGLEEILGKAYSTFTNIKAGEFRSGSSAAVKWMVQEMHAVVASVVSAIPTSAPEANAKRLAVQINTRMGHYFNSSWEYKTIEEIKEAVVGTGTGGILTEAQWTDATTGFVGAKDLNTYPYGDFKIPEGAAQLQVDANGVFSYKHPNAALVTPDTSFEPRKYLYMPELLYYVNSPVRVTDKADLAIADYPNGVAPWDDESSSSKWTAGNWTVGKVASSTRGVAVRDNINYGVALLKTSVSWTDEANTAGHLLDNRSAMTGGAETDRQIALGDTKLELKGVLVGGVNPRMNWQFLRKYTVDDPDNGMYPNFDGVIYDDNMANTAVPTTADNYTLVYDNYDSGSAANAQRNVYVALEFVNNGDAFWGKDNLIRSGGTFYLYAKLTNDATHQASITWPTHYQIPPLYGVDDGEPVPAGKTAGESKQIPRVFIQNFMTIANFKLGLNSLKNAYVTVPDLRSSQMSLGLSVDLSWQSGYTYDVAF